MTSEMLCDIVIVNWNSGALLNNCVRSIFNVKNKNLIPSIIIVDNASADNSLDSIEPTDNVHIIRNDRNLGFAPACNQGIVASDSKYILFLNPDTELLENTLIDSITFLENHSEIDVLGIKHINNNGITKKSCSRFPTLKNYFYDIFGLSKVSPNIFNPATIMTDLDHETSRFVDQVMGAFMITRRSSIDAFGKFDEQFFVYYEDLDFAHRVRDGGGKTYYLSDVEVYHHGGGTTSSFKDIRLFYSLRSRLLYCSKYFSKPQYYSILFLTILIEPITRMIFLVMTVKLNEIPSLFKGYKMLYDFLIRAK